MPTYNRVHRIMKCKNCENDYSVIREIKFGYIWCLYYTIGESVELDGRGNIPVEKLKNINCPHCSGEFDFDIMIKNGKVHSTPRSVRNYLNEQRKQKIKA